MKKLSFNDFYFSKSKTNFNDSYYDFVSAISLGKNTFFIVAIKDDDIYSDSQVELSIIKKIGLKEMYSPTLVNPREFTEKILSEEICEINYKKFMSLFKEEKNNFKYKGYIGKGDVCQYTISILIISKV